jgi:DNA-directed RNA polymerase sigma subunit (sigma70/sigma32)
LDVKQNGSLKINFPDRDPDLLDETCVLDVAERGEHTTARIGVLMNMTRSRIDQIERKALGRLPKKALRDQVGARS